MPRYRVYGIRLQQWSDYVEVDATDEDDAATQAEGILTAQPPYGDPEVDEIEVEHVEEL